MRTKNLAGFLFITLFFVQFSWAQNNVGINTITPDPTAALEVAATDKGMLIPRLTTAQRGLIPSPATGLLLFDTDTATFWFYNGTTWIELIDTLNDADSDPANEFNTGATLTGTTLNVIDGGGTQSVNLAALQDGVNDADSDPANEFNTGATLSGTTLNVIDGGGTQSVNLAALQDGVNDADSDPANEFNTGATLTGTTLNVIDGGGTQSVNLAALQDGVNDADSNPANEFNTNVTLTGTTLNVIDGGGAQSVNLASLVNDSDWAVNGNNMSSIPTGNVGIGTTTPETALHVFETNSGFLAAAKIEGVFGPTSAYLGVQGADNYDGDLTLDIAGREIGVIGVSTGSSTTDNIGVLGHSNTIGGLFQYTNGTAVLERVEIATSARGLTTFGDNGSINVSLFENGANQGRFALYNDASAIRFQAFAEAAGVGGALTYGPSSVNIGLGYLTGFPNNGFVYVRDAAGADQAGMYVAANGQGIVFGDVKNFRMDHPEDDSKEIWYASLEGPEAAAYVRGTASLKNGKVSIQFPDHFALVANPQTITVTLTPNSTNSKGLAVTDKSAEGFVVGELMNGTGTYTFDWVAMAVRKGYEDYSPVREKRNLSGLTSPADAEVVPLRNVPAEGEQ